MAEDEATQRAKKLVEEDKKVREKSAAEFAERSKGKPTPTQEENDIAAYGGHIMEKEDDGSGPDPFMTRNVEANKPGQAQSYSTRQHQPQHQTQHQPPSSSSRRSE